MAETILVQANRIEGYHLRMARAGLQLSIRELAILCHVNKATIVRIESGQAVRNSTLSVIRETLEGLGANFWQCHTNHEVLVSVEKV